jgi:hypothetical protein
MEDEDARRDRIRTAVQLEHETRTGRRNVIEAKEKRQQQLEARLALIKQKEKKRKAQDLGLEFPPEPPVEKPAKALYDPSNLSDDEEEDAPTFNPHSVEKSIDDLFASVKSSLKQ